MTVRRKFHGGVHLLPILPTVSVSGRRKNGIRRTLTWLNEPIPL